MTIDNGPLRFVQHRRRLELRAVPEAQRHPADTGGPPLVWTVQPDDARSSLYRSGTSGLSLRREFRFGAAMLRAGGNEITLRINTPDAPAELNNWAAYDAIRLELTG